MNAPRLRGYQEEAVDYLRTHDAAGLFLDMGLGKTAIVLSALEPRHLPALVVAPPRVAAETWPAELKLWRPDLSFEVARGKPAKRADALASGADVVLISRDTLADAVPYAARFGSLVLDELSSFKSHTSQRFRAARAISKRVPVRWGLTGTPAPNGLLDLWAEAFILDHGAALGPRFGEFRSTYFVEGRRSRTGVVWEYRIRPGAEELIHTRMESLAISMDTAGRVELPGFHVNPYPVAIPASVRETYESFREDLAVGLDVLGDVRSFMAANAATLTDRLSQITSGFLYEDTLDRVDGEPARWTPLHEAKLDALAEIVEGANGSPVLVFVRYRVERERILERFHGRRGVPLATDAKAVRGNLQEQWNAGAFPVLVSHPATIGHGLNLQQGGHTIVWTTPPWPLEEWDQANKRLHRSGQTHPVVSHVLTVPGTVDELILSRLRDKADVQDALRDHLAL